MADSACYIELASNNGDFFTNSLTDDIMIRPQYATQNILIGTSNGQVSTLTITSNNVGIGTTTPAYKLDVSGDINFTGSFCQNGTPYIGSQWSNNSSNVFLLGSNVGIATSAPTEQLQVSGKIYSGTQILNNSNDSASVPSFSFKENSNTGMFHPANNTVGFTTGGTERLRVDSSGKVGIGTTTPAYLLDVNGTMNCDSLMVNPSNITGTSSTYTASNIYCLLQAPAGSNVSYGGDIYGEVGFLIGLDKGDKDGNSKSKLKICHGVGAAGPNFTSPRVTLDTNGYVGIGTSSPTSTLHVVGNTTLNGGNAIGVQNGQDGGTGRGIYMWGLTDTSWGMYMAQSGASKSLSGGTAVAGSGFSSYAVRIRTGPATTQGFIVENSSEALLMSVRGDGLTYFGNNATAYNASIGNAGHGAAFAAFAHSNQFNTSTYALLSQDTGDTYLNSASGRPIRFREGNVDKAMLSNGNFGIGTTSPAYKLDVTGDIRASGEIISTSQNSFRMVQGNYGIFGRNDGSDYYMMLTSSGSPYGSYNALRPFRINLSSGEVYIGDTSLYVANAGNVGVGTTLPSYKLHVSGDIYATGDIIGFSDLRLKSNINIIDDALAKIHKINGYTYNLPNDEKKHTGLIAQEVIEVLPEAVHQEKKEDETEGYYSLAYGNMVGLLVEAIKEIDNKYKSQITDLQEQISILKNEIDILKNKSN